MPEIMNLLCDILLILCIIQVVFTSILAFSFGNLLKLINCKLVNGLGVISGVVTIPIVIQVRNELETALISKTYGTTIWYQRYGLCVSIILYSACKLTAIQTLIWSSKVALISDFSKLMKAYLTPHNKKLIDRIQILLLCCGSNNYTDWFKYDWSIRNYTENLNAAKQLDLEDYSIPNNNNNYNMDIVPFSCCSISSLEPCQHDDLQMNGADLINRKGCGKTLEEFSIFLITIEFVYYSLVLFVEASIMIILKRKWFSFENDVKSQTLLKSILKKSSYSTHK